jgi:hypothetical protein
MSGNTAFEKYVRLFDMSGEVMKTFMRYIYGYLMEFRKKEMQASAQKYTDEFEKDAKEATDRRNANV